LSLTRLLCLSVSVMLVLLPVCAYASTQTVTSPWTIGQGGSDNAASKLQLVPLDAHINTNSATGTACPSTSWTLANTNTVLTATLTGSGTSGQCSRIVLEFDTSVIPNDAVISSVQLKFNVTSVTNARNCDYNAITATEPIKDTAAGLWTAIAGSSYVSNDSTCTTTGAKTVTLGSTANSDLTTKLASDNYFAVGIKFNSETRDGSAHTVSLASTESTNAQKPQLVVTFTSQHNKYIIGGSATETPETGFVSTNSATGTSCPSTSYTKTNTGTTDELKLGGSGASNSCERAYSQFDPSGVNSGYTTVHEVLIEINRQTQSNVNQNCDVVGLSSKPSGRTAAQVWSDASGGSVYLSNNAFCSETILTAGTDNVPARLILGSTANTEFSTEYANGYFAYAVKFNSETRDATTRTFGYQNVRATINQERLIIETTISKNVNETLSITGANTKSDSKSFNQALAIAGANTKADYKTFTEAITLAYAYAFGIHKTFTDAIGIVADNVIIKESIIMINEALQLFGQHGIEVSGGSGEPTDCSDETTGGVPCILGGIALMPIVFGMIIIMAIIFPVAAIRRRRRE